MRHQLLLAAGAALVLGWAGQAAAAPAGQVGASYSRMNLKVDSDKGDANVWQADGSIAAPVTGMLNLALDGAVQNIDADKSSTLYTATGHADLRAGDKALVGVFVGADHTNSITLWGGGVEAQLNGDAGGVVGQIGYGHSGDLDGVKFWGERIEGRFYPRDNIRLSLGFDGTQLKSDGGGDTSLWNLRTAAEYQLSNVPVSVWAGYDRGEWSDANMSSNTWTIGVRYNFGGSLRDRDAAGSSMGGVGQLFGGSLGSTVITALGVVL